MSFKKNKLIHNMPSVEYHSTANTYSSSQLKVMLEDEELFFKKYIERSLGKDESSSFSVGTYFHTGVLEPHLLEEECAVFDGVRRGTAWDKFLKANSGKAIVSKKEKESAEKLIELVKNSSVAMEYIEQGDYEVSLFVDLLVDGSDIYAPDFEVCLSHFAGWVKVPKRSIPKRGVRITVKVRADVLGEEFVLDLKSTSGNAKNDFKMKDKIRAYTYDLSASFYLDIFSLMSEKPIETFIWTFASKDYHNCASYVASPKSVLVGRRKWSRAISRIAYGIRTNWQFPDVLGVIEPQVWDLDLLKETDADLL